MNRLRQRESPGRRAGRNPVHVEMPGGRAPARADGGRDHEGPGGRARRPRPGPPLTSTSGLPSSSSSSSSSSSRARGGASSAAGASAVFAVFVVFVVLAVVLAAVVLATRNWAAVSGLNRPGGGAILAGSERDWNCSTPRRAERTPPATPSPGRGACAPRWRPPGIGRRRHGEGSLEQRWRLRRGRRTTS